MNKITPLQRFLTGVGSKSDKEQLAAESGTTYVYLHQLAARPWPDPRLRLALQLVKASKRLSKKWMLEPLTLEDLLIGTADESEIPGPGAD